MLDLKTGKEDPNLIGDISIDASFIDKGSFFMEALARHLLSAYKENKKFRAVLEYDPEDVKARITFRLDGECSRPGQLCKFDKPFDRMVVYQTKEAAEQASKEKIKAFPPGAPINKILCSTSEAFCDSLLPSG